MTKVTRRKGWLVVLLVVLMNMFVVSCGGDAAKGSGDVGGWHEKCYDNNTCDSRLECIDSICVADEVADVDSEEATGGVDETVDSDESADGVDETVDSDESADGVDETVDSDESAGGVDETVDSEESADDDAVADDSEESDDTDVPITDVVCEEVLRKDGDLLLGSVMECELVGRYSGYILTMYFAVVSDMSSLTLYFTLNKESNVSMPARLGDRTVDMLRDRHNLSFTVTSLDYNYSDSYEVVTYSPVATGVVIGRIEALIDIDVDGVYYHLP